MGRGAILRASAAAEVELIEVDELAEPPEPRTALGLQVGEDDRRRHLSPTREGWHETQGTAARAAVGDAWLRRVRPERRASERLRADIAQRRGLDCGRLYSAWHCNGADSETICPHPTRLERRRAAMDKDGSSLRSSL